MTDKLVNLSVVVKDGLAVPPYKVSSSLPSGKISLERKPDSEVNSEKAMTAVSMTYLLAGVAFDVSPNIQYVRQSLYERAKRSALLWAEFDRDRFSQIDVAAVDVIADILGCPSVIMCNREGDGAELQPMEEEYFNKQVALQVSQADSSHLLKRP